MFSSRKNKNLGRLILLASLIFTVLLAACGDTNPLTTDNNFTLPAYDGLEEVPILEAAPDFTSKILLQNDPKFTEKNIKVFQTNANLDDVKNFYLKQLVNQGWVDRTPSLVGPKTLGPDGWILGFEKAAGNSDQRGRGIIMLNPQAQGTDNLLKPYRDNGTLASNKNVLVVVDTLFSPNGTAPLPTATPKV